MTSAGEPGEVLPTQQAIPAVEVQQPIAHAPPSYEPNVGNLSLNEPQSSTPLLAQPHHTEVLPPPHHPDEHASEPIPFTQLPHEHSGILPPPHHPDEHVIATPRSGLQTAPQLPPRGASPALSEKDHHLTAEEAAQNEAPITLPDEASGATVAFLIPFPPSDAIALLKAKEQDKIPPFCLYAPLAPRLTKPVEGKESLLHKAQRKWEEEEDSSRGKKGIKAKGIGLISKGMSFTKSSGVEFLMRTPDKQKLKEIRMLYPKEMPAADLKDTFVKFIGTTKKRSQRNSVISTALTPVALAFDTVTFIVCFPLSHLAMSDLTCAAGSL